jgi:hypothetical protein
VPEWKYEHGTAVRSLAANCGQRRIDVVARDDGLFQFHAHSFYDDDLGKNWLPEAPSGLYATLDDAERAARAEIDR